MRGCPLGAQRLDDRGQDESFDVSTGREMGAELMSLPGAKGAFEQGAEDRGLDVAPICLGGL